MRNGIGRGLIVALLCILMVPMTACSDRETEVVDRNDTGGNTDVGGDSGGDVGDRALTILDLQDESSPNHPSADSSVTVSGVITAIDTLPFGDDDETVGSFYIQDPAGGAYSGIYAFNQGGNAVDVSGLVVGNTVEVSGTYAEYEGLSEIRLSSVTVTDDTTSAPEPADVEAAAVATGGADAELWEGVLVRVSDVTVVDGNIGFGKFELNDGLEVSTALYRPSTMPFDGAQFTSLTGVMQWTFDAAVLEPRFEADYDGGETTVVPVTVTDLQDDSSDDHPTMGTVVEVTGVIVTAISRDGVTDGDFWIQDAGGGQYSGIAVYNSHAGAMDVSELNVGDEIALTGRFTSFDYQDSDRYQTVNQISLVFYEVTDTGGTADAVVVADPSTVETDGSATAAYQGVLITLENVTSTADTSEFGEFPITGGLIVGDELWSPDTDYDSGTAFDSITGILHPLFENYVLLPRSADDIETTE